MKFKEFQIMKNSFIEKNKFLEFFFLIDIFQIFFFFNKIFFLEINIHLQNKKFLSFLELLGIVWLNYNDYNLEHVHALKLKKSTIFCDKYSFYISKKIWIKSLSFFFINKNLLAGCINRKIKDNILSIYEIMEVGQLLKKKMMSIYLYQIIFF